MTYVRPCLRWDNQARQQRGAILDTYHLLDVVGGAQGVLPVTVVDVVHLARMLIAGGVGNREARRARVVARGPLLLDGRTLGVGIVPHLGGTGRGGGHGTGGPLLDSSCGPSLASLPGGISIAGGVHIDAGAELSAGGSGCASRSLTLLLEHGELCCKCQPTLYLVASNSFDRSMSDDGGSCNDGESLVRQLDWRAAIRDRFCRATKNRNKTSKTVILHKTKT